MNLEPIVKRIEVALAAAAAFALFTREMSVWWPLATHACSEGGGLRVDIDERIGGQIRETGKDGRHHLWGTVTEWAPPRCFAMTWHPARPPEEATHVQVSFEDIAPGRCAVTVVHGGWAPRGQEARESYEGGWVGVLELFRQAASKQPGGRA